ncbi:hypothetical protein AAF712_000462 [Marasmius tenuissimus]|uniref:Uncharacterized protein n=1 Tax=Marasmius tenuissimus TaxID=585030 RepID=A0ABR3AID1_9AGAR
MSSTRNPLSDTESESGTATPLPRQEAQSAVKELSSSYTHLTASLRSSGAQCANVGRLGPTTSDAELQITRLKGSVKERTRKQRETREATKTWVREDLRNQILSQIRNDLKSDIKLQVASAVKTQVDEQLKNHIPIPLRDQLADCDEQLRRVEVLLVNSKARRNHAHYDLTTSLNEPLLVVQRESGGASSVYPSDLETLFTYDDDALKQLLGDYGLKVDDRAVTNVNRFLAHIGIKHPVEEMSLMAEG